MHALVPVTAEHRRSAELGLALRMFLKALPEDMARTILPEEPGAGPGLRAGLLALLERDRAGGPILVVEDPAMIMGQNTATELERVLDRHPDIDCVIPSDIRDHREGIHARYATLRGFQRFVDDIQDPERDAAPYDGRRPLLFLVRRAALDDLPLPDDPMEIPGLLRERCATALNAYVHPFGGYYEKGREDLVAYVPEGTKSLLDVGCARGKFAQAVRAQRGCTVAGIEQNPLQAAHARRHLDALYEGDALTVSVRGPFDCVTCLDALEHFQDPAALLRRVRGEFLRAGGHLLLTVPNVGHGSIVEDLLAGRWDYVPAGPLCITHLRFFTWQGIRELLDESGFLVKRMERIRLPVSDAFAVVLKCLGECGIEIDEAGLDTLGFIVLARKA